MPRSKPKNAEKHAVSLLGIGKVDFSRSRRAKYLRISVRPFHGVRVIVPAGISFARAEKFVHEKRDWIARNLQKARVIEQKSLIQEGLIETREHVIEIRTVPIARLTIQKHRGGVRIRIPKTLPLGTVEVQAMLREVLVEVYRREAKAYLPKRLKYLAGQYSFSYNRVFIKNHRSRWGSCSARNNINLSLHLMKLPEELIDYVLLHELVHTRVKSHSKQFWQALEQVCPNARRLDKKLRQWSASQTA